MSPRFLWILLTALVPLASPLPLAAQAADSTAKDEARPLFGTRDAWFAGGFVLGTVALAPLDVTVANAVRDSLLQENQLVSQGAAGLRWLGFPGSVVAGGGLYAAGWIADDSDLAGIGLHMTEAVLLGTAATVAVKALVGRARPRREPDNPFNFGIGRGIARDDYRSFPSGHTTAAFATAAALTTEIGHRSPESKLLAGSILYAGAALMGVSRLYHNEHWASDVIMGAAIGSFSGWKVVDYNLARPGNRLDRALLPRGRVEQSLPSFTIGWRVLLDGPR